MAERESEVRMEKQRNTKTRPKVRPAKKIPGSRVVEFPQIKGRTVEKVQLFTSAEAHSISIRFADKTDLRFVIDSWFTFQADHSDWRTGNQRVLKRWPAIRSKGM